MARQHEKNTTDFSAILNAVVNNEIPAAAGLKRVASNLLLKTVGQIDVCAQQAAHVIASLKLVSHSRDIVHLTVDGGAIQDNVTANIHCNIRKYMNRPAEYENLTLFQSVKQFRIHQLTTMLHSIRA